MIERRQQFAIGVDFGTNSVRAIVCDLSDGEAIASAIVHYPSGLDGVFYDPGNPNLARQNPGDFLFAFERVVSSVVRQAELEDGFTTEGIVGLGVDTTASSPIPLGKNGIPLALEEPFTNHLGAYCYLWKDHTSFAEAEEINQLCQTKEFPYLKSCGGSYSSEWFWSKLLYCAKVHPEVMQASETWIELQDFIPAYACDMLGQGVIPRGICAAGHKGMFHPDWGGWPIAAFLKALHPELARIRKTLPDQCHENGTPIGMLGNEFAKKVGLHPGIPVATGVIDAHSGAIGSGIRPGRVVKILGTSSCDIAVLPLSKNSDIIPGLAGCVPGSVLPGMIGVEAGQAAVGDLLQWFVGLVGKGHDELMTEAALVSPGQSGLLALDWNNGNRNVLMNPSLSGLVLGQTLHTTPAEVYRALIEATAFGARRILDRMREYGVPCQEIVTGGGIAEKNPLLMQIYADVCGIEWLLPESDQTCAMGAAIVASVAGAAYETVDAASANMTSVKELSYKPIPEHQKVYDQLYELYLRLHDAFGGVADVGLDGMMRQLRSISEQVRLSNQVKPH